MSSEWNFAPDVIVKAQEIGIGARVVAHWTEFECPDQGGTVVGVEIHRYGKVEYTVHLDGDISPTDGFSHDPTGQKPGTISIRSGGEEKDGVGVGLIGSMSDEEFNRDRSDENPNVGKADNIADAGKMVGVGVKPLEWTKYGEAKGAYAKYTVYESGGSTWNAVCYPYEESHYRLAEGVSEAEAKAAACAHHSTAILSALTNTKPSLRAENERLRKELDHAQKLFRTLQDATTADVNAKAKLDEAVKVLERIADIAERNFGRQNEKLADIAPVARSFLSNLKGAE